ncbi:hypothetical protein [Clostridium perfringens]|uniref:hypothetical protein n=1 Tax=Clostridium perfringens TaxID=1502 RepID=UPI00234194BB|nr:hypothetical protein [Clostridium perfringens]MDC4243450.1 hypothetical protein [Clostridium perfringens]
MITHKEDFIDYDKFYTKHELEQILEGKGITKGEFIITKFKRALVLFRALKLKNTELFDNLITKDESNNHVTLILKEFVDGADWEFFKRLKNIGSNTVYDTFIRKHFDDSVDYDKFYTKYEFCHILKNKGFNNSASIFTSIRTSMERYNAELADNTFASEGSTRYLILKDFVDCADWEFFKTLKNTRAAYETFIRKHFDDSVDYDNFYTKIEFDLILKSNDFLPCNTTIDMNFFYLKRAIEKYSKELADNIFTRVNYNQYLILKEFVDNIDWKFAKILLEKRTGNTNLWGLIVENHFEGYIPQYDATIILGYRHTNCRAINEVIEEDNDIFTTIKKDGIRKVKTEDVIRWLEFKNSVISLGEIYNSVVDGMGVENLGSKSFHFNNKAKLIKDGFFHKYNPINPNDTPFRMRSKNELYIDIKYKNEVHEQLQHQLSYKTVETFGSKKDKFNYRLNQIIPKNNKVTLNEFSKFAISRISELVKPNATSYINILDKLESLGKEIMLLTTEEVIEITNSLSTKDAKEEFTNFLNKLRSQRPTKYSQIEYDVEHNKQSTNHHIPYTEEQYQRFGFLVLSNSHIWYDEYMEKALAKRRYASVWLYSTLHYICAWRAGDLIDTLPHPDLKVDANTFLNKVKSKTLTKKEALDIVEQVNMNVKFCNLKPSKTASNTTPSLVMEIPESLYEFVGILIGICEAHYQLSPAKNKRGLIATQATERETQVEFYGKEFVEIFGESSFSNLKAVKNYEMIMSRKADEKEFGTGYMLASIARAHKFKLDKKAETTMVYLKYYKNMEDAEAIVTELFERGVCSCIPYMLTKIVAGEKNILSLTHAERTKKIKEIAGMDAFESEMLIQSHNSALDMAKTKVDEIIQSAICDGLEPKEIAKNILLNIIYNEAPSKQGDMPCMIIAQGKPCIYPKRENCVGCGHEIYLKSCLFELGSRIHQAKELALNSKTQASKNKNILMIKNVLSPIVAEIFITLKDVYEIENIDDLKKLIR